MAMTAQEWKQANRKEVALPSGRTVLLRKLTTEFLLVQIEMQEEFRKLGLRPEPVLGPDGEPEVDKKTGKPVTRINVPRKYHKRYIELLVLEAVVIPKVVPSDVDPAEDQMHVTDFGADLDPLVTAIHAHNGDVLELPFRSSPNGETPAPAGEGVRGDTERVAEEAAPGPIV